MSLIYNGISFPYTRTRQHVMGPVKDPSGTDQLFTKIRLESSFILYVNSLTGIGLIPAQLGVDFNAGQLLARIRHMLTAPRKALYYDFLSLPGSTAGLPPSAIINIPDGRDDANGPWPDERAFSIDYTTADCLEGTWAVDVYLQDCFGFNPDEPLSIRWEDSISWDKYAKATYQRSGTAIISSRSSKKIDDYRRNTFAPRIAPGFHRTRAHYTCSRDALRCDFVFIDEQIRYAPPYPAVEMDIIQSESFPLVGGMKQGEVTVLLEGIQNANVRDLAMWAVTIAKARIWAATPLSTQEGKVIGNCVLKSRETTKGVDVACSAQYKVNPNGNQEQQQSGGPSFWGGVGGFGIGFAIGGPVGAIIGAGIGAFGGGGAQATPEGKDPTKTPPFGWLGVGTSPASPTNPNGYAPWASPTGQVGGPADGVGLAPAVCIFAALLQDPCGAELASTPFANTQVSELRTNVNTFNSGSAGQGGSTSVSDSQLTASLSTFNAAQYPQILSNLTPTGLYTWDGRPGAYDYWQCLSEYLDDPGTIVIPTANPNGVNIAVNHSSHMVTLRKRWAAMRQGSTPNLPPIDPGDANLVYVGGIAPALRELRSAPDGASIVYEAQGVYDYQVLDESKLDRNAEIPPFLNATVLTQVKGWFEGLGTLSTGGGSGFSIGGSGGSPLGSGSLLSPFPI